MSERVARLRIELQELEPKIWRCIDMPFSTTLEALHEAIQMTMGWTFSHLWEFDIDGRCYGDPSFREFDDEPPIYKAKGLRLGVVISRGVARFVYTYDYGDNWRHDVIVEEVRDGDPDREYPAFVDGARRCPPEDVGGSDGFMDFLDQRAVFEDGAWSGIRPHIAVYDSVFVNENVFSGDVVTNEHLKKQYGMVVGEEGVRRVRRIVELDNENRENNSQSRVVETELDGIVRAVGPDRMTRKEYDRHTRRDQPKKDIWLRPLRKDWRRTLNR